MINRSAGVAGLRRMARVVPLIFGLAAMSTAYSQPAATGGKAPQAGATQVEASIPRIDPVTNAGKRGHPFHSQIVDLKKDGYTEEEYFLTGRAVRYLPSGELKPDGKWSVSPDI